MKKPNSVIENFAPAWFASVMGTGVVAITSYYYSTVFAWLKGLATTVFLLNILLFGLLIIPWVLRFILYKGKTLADLRDPVAGQFYATMPIACLVLAANLLIIGIDIAPVFSIGLAKGLWIGGTLIALVFAVTVPLLNFTNREARIENVNPAWFMPPVSLIIIPVPGAKLIAYWPEGWQQIMLILNYISWGSGFFLFLLLEAIVIYRFICCPPLPGKLAPTAWINLGPIGAGSIAIINLASVSTPFLGEVVEPVLNLFALFLWGFGFWWVICAVCLTFFYLRNNNLPFSLAWWAFTFPLGAYAGATYLVAGFLNAPFIYGYGFVFYLALLAIWPIVFGRTMVGIVKKEFY